jgi:hypothetical protein
MNGRDSACAAKRIDHDNYREREKEGGSWLGRAGMDQGGVRSLQRAESLLIEDAGSSEVLPASRHA